MANRWTPQQEQAINLHNRNLLVSAAAGSGKTAVLVERIIRMITEEPGVDVDHLLVLTFTRAAAMEMKERIGNRINRMMAQDSDNDRLKRQYALLNHANITTIDSFCLRIVRDYFGELDLDPDFRVGDEGELTLLQADCMEELLETYYEDADPDFLEFAEAYGGDKGDYLIEQYIGRVYRFAQSCPYPEDWMKEVAEGFQVSTMEELEQLPFMTFLKSFYCMLFEELEQQAIELLNICMEQDGPYAYEDMMRSDLQQIHQLTQANTFQDLCSKITSIKFVRKTTKKQIDIDESKKAIVSAGRDEVKKRVQKVAAELKSIDVDHILDAIQGIRKPMETLLKLTGAFSELYQKAKAEKNIVDFNDLEHLALSVLIKKGEGRTAAARELQQQFAEILVDEYQDSNYLQDMLLESISGKEEGHPNMFMVGDVKQSIYRFRMARPEIFMDKYESYTREDSLYQKIDLQKNFRSRSQVLEGINRIFERIMRKSLGNIEYDAEAALYPGADYPDYPMVDESEHKDGTETKENFNQVKENRGSKKALKLLMIDMDKQELAMCTQEEQQDSEINNVAAEAHAAAEQIRRITNPQYGQMVLDKETGEYHRATYRDIVILLRSMTGKVETYLDVLTAEGIPACALATGYFDALEVKVILSFLQIIDNPVQDIPLAAVMKSPIGNFAADELAEIMGQSDKKEDGLYYAVKNYLEKCADTFLAEKLITFFDGLNSYREKAGYLRVYEFLQLIYQETGYYDYVSAMPAGSVRKTNLDMLVEKAISYEQTSYHGLFHFVRYLEHLKKYEVDFEQGQAFGEQDDIIRIYSIHKSKGLEYPIVILGGMAKKFNQMDSRSAVMLHPELGIAADYIDIEKRCKIPSAASVAISQRLKLDTLGEELRILYVAMTRARETLIMTAADPHLKKHLEEYDAMYNDGNALPFHKISAAGSYLDWVLMAAADRRDLWMDVEILSAKDVFSRPAVRQAEQMSILSELRSLPLRMKEEGNVLHTDTLKHLEQLKMAAYSFEESVKIQSKFSVSELKRLSGGTAEEKQEEQDLLLPELVQMPAFMKEETSASGTDRGTAYHRILELLPPDKTWHTDVISQEIEYILAEGKMKPEAAALVKPWKLYELYQSDLGKRMQSAYKGKKMHREKQFIYSIAANKVNDIWQSDEPVLIQGIIDAYFEENGKLILVDYKTDYGVTEEQLKQRYFRQFELYKNALEQITGKDVSEMYLWSFYLEKSVKM